MNKIKNLFILPFCKDCFMPNVNFNRPWNCRKLYTLFYIRQMVANICTTTPSFFSLKGTQVFTIKVDSYSFLDGNSLNFLLNSNREFDECDESLLLERKF